MFSNAGTTSNSNYNFWQGKRMTEEVKEQLIKRVKSFAWRLGSYIVVSGLALLVDSLGILNLDPAVVTVVALVCGEITKYLNAVEN